VNDSQETRSGSHQGQPALHSATSAAWCVLSGSRIRWMTSWGGTRLSKRCSNPMNSAERCPWRVMPYTVLPTTQKAARRAALSRVHSKQGAQPRPLAAQPMFSSSSLPLVGTPSEFQPIIS